jgi:HK97 family phage portal protein
VPIVNDPVYGPKPAISLAGGSPTSLAQGSSPFLPGGRSITLTGDGWRTISFDRLYRTQPLVGTAAKRLTEAVARAPLHLNRYLDDAGDARERSRDHPAAQLLDRPRPGRTGFHLRWDIALSLYVHGHYIGWKRRPGRGAPPSELWTLDWRYVVPHRIGTAGPIVRWEWLGDGVPGLERGQKIDPVDVLSIGFGAPSGSEVGISPLEQLGVTLRLDDAVRRHSEASFANGTRFGALVRLHKDVSADKAIRDGLRDELIDAHGGVDQAFRPAILGGGVEGIETIAQSAVEAELISQRKVNRDEVAAVYGGAIGPLLGAIEAANYASIREFHRILYVTVLPGPLDLIAAGVQASIIDGEPAWSGDGLFSEFNLDGVLRGDTKERWDTYAIALGCGGLTLNDVRRKENLTPYDDPRADEPLIAANNVRPLSAVGTGPTGNGTAGRRSTDGSTDESATSAVLELVASHSTRAIERAARGVGAGRGALEALDTERVARELAEDLEAAGHNGTSLPLAQALAAELEHLLEGASSVDDVRAAAAAHPLTSETTA